MTENRRLGRQFSQTVKEKTTQIGKETLSFFGITEPKCDEIEAWNQRRLRFALQKFGSINTQKLQSDLPESNNSIMDDFNDAEQITPFKISEKPRPTYFRGRSAPGLFNRQISLHSNLVAPTDLDTITSVGSYGYRKQNAVKALGRMISIKKSKPSVNGDDLSRKSRIISISNQNINHIEAAFFDNFQAKSNRKKLTRKNLHDNFIFRLICCLMKHDKESESICSKIDDSVQYRPYFTYWMTCVQILVFIIGVSYYGFAPVGLQMTTKYQKEVILPNQGRESVCWHEYDNLWFGPRQSDLIRLGARYSPCMRIDKNLKDVILDPQIERERHSGCCIRNDGGGCYQSYKQFCSLTLSTWLKYPKSSTSDSRNYSGLVCGLDPDFCKDTTTVSMRPFQWGDDITKWPLCLETTKMNKSISNTVPHMKCEITGRPCCVGIKGECIITTQSHCTFMRGYFHQEAHLCSQINCLGEICGMLSFADSNIPDQIYRLFISLFLHVGIVHLIITVLMQAFFLRDFEKLMGWLRTAMIYILSGVMGNLMSAVFLPYKVEAGPSGSCFAFLGIIIIEFLKSWKLIKSPWKVLLKYFLFTLFLFVIGLLPWIDNYAHIAGLVSGILLSFVFLPFLGLPDNKFAKSLEEFNTLKTVQRRRTLMWRISTLLICAILWLIGLSFLIYQFKYQPPIDCKWCTFLTCIPIGKSFCDNMDVNVTAQTPCLLFIT